MPSLHVTRPARKSGTKFTWPCLTQGNPNTARTPSSVLGTSREISFSFILRVTHTFSLLLSFGSAFQATSLMSTNAIIAGMLASAIDNTVLSAASEEDAIVKNETDNNNEAGFK